MERAIRGTEKNECEVEEQMITENDEQLIDMIMKEHEKETDENVREALGPSSNSLDPNTPAMKRKVKFVLEMFCACEADRFTLQMSWMETIAGASWRVF